MPNIAIFQKPFVMRHNDHCSAKPPHNTGQEVHIGEVEIVGRLVQQQKFGFLRAQNPQASAARSLSPPLKSPIL
jgi:hypothetical protein